MNVLEIEAIAFNIGLQSLQATNLAFRLLLGRNTKENYTDFDTYKAINKRQLATVYQILN